MNTFCPSKAQTLSRVQPPVTTTASKNLCDSLHILQVHSSSFFCFCTGFAMSSLLEFHQNTSPRSWGASPGDSGVLQDVFYKKPCATWIYCKSMYPDSISITFSIIYISIPGTKGTWWKGILFVSLFHLFNSPFASFSNAKSRLLHPWLSCSCREIHTNPQPKDWNDCRVEIKHVTNIISMGVSKNGGKTGKTPKNAWFKSL